MLNKLGDVFKIVQGLWLIVFVFLGFLAIVNPTPFMYFVVSSMVLMGVGATGFIAANCVAYALVLIVDGYRALRGLPPTDLMP